MRVVILTVACEGHGLLVNIICPFFTFGYNHIASHGDKGTNGIVSLHSLLTICTHWTLDGHDLNDMGSSRGRQARA
jgi:hypothetical protein